VAFSVRCPGATSRYQLTKTQIVCQKNAIFISRHCEDIWILKLVKPLLGSVNPK
jgi:hypothetical protein